MENLKDEIIDNLREVYDPELPINIYDLGLIYNIEIQENNRVFILMTLTSPTCPTADFIKSQIEEAAMKVSGVESCEVEVTFDPPWSPDKVSDEAKEELGFFEKPKIDTSISHVFNTEENKKGFVDENLCFNCSISESDKPLFQARYKGENVLVCPKCLKQFE